MTRRIIEIILEIEGDFDDDPGEIASELEGYVTVMCPGAYRVNGFVVRDEEV